MTQLMGRPILGLPSQPVTRSALADLLAGVRTALLTLSVIAVPVLGLWVLAPYGNDTAVGALSFSCSLWLLGHGAPLARGPHSAPLTMTPLLLTVLDAVLLYRAARRITRRARWQPRAPLAFGLGYLAVAACAVALCGGNDSALRSRPVPDLFAVAVLVAGALVLGLPHVEPPKRWRQWVPGGAWAEGGAEVIGRSAALWLSGMLASGGVLLSAVVLLGDAGRPVGTAGGGIAGLLGLLLACALLMPNAALWAACYALGPGFRVGVGTVAAPTGTRVGAVPDFPLFALVPGTGGAGWRPLILLLPLLAGVLPALLLGRAALQRGWRPGALSAAVLGSAALVGAVATVASWAAGGALARGRMSALGPVPWLVGPIAAGWVVLVVLPAALCSAQWPGGARLLLVQTARIRAAVYRAVARTAELRLGRE